MKTWPKNRVWWRHRIFDFFIFFTKMCLFLILFPFLSKYFYQVMCGSNRSSTTPLSGKGGDIPLVWRPTLGANTVSGVPTLGLTQNQWSRPWGYHSTLTRKKVMSPPFPDRGWDTSDLNHTLSANIISLERLIIQPWFIASINRNMHFPISVSNNVYV